MQCVNAAHNSNILADEYKYRVMQHCVQNFFEPSIYNISSSHVAPWLQNLEYSTLYPNRFNRRRLVRHHYVPYYERQYNRGYRRGFRQGQKQQKNKQKQTHEICSRCFYLVGLSCGIGTTFCCFKNFRITFCFFSSRGYLISKIGLLNNVSLFFFCKPFCAGDADVAVGGSIFECQLETFLRLRN